VDQGIQPNHAQFPCLEIANPDYRTIAGILCEECINLIPPEFHNDDCWCPSCVQMPEVLDASELNHGAITIILLNVLQNPDGISTQKVGENIEHLIRYHRHFTSVRCRHIECRHLFGYGPTEWWGNTSPHGGSNIDQVKLVPGPELRWLIDQNFVTIRSKWRVSSITGRSWQDTMLYPTQRLFDLEDQLFPA